MTFFWLIIMSLTLISGSIATSFAMYDPIESFMNYQSTNNLSQIPLHQREKDRSYTGKGDKLKTKLDNSLKDELTGYLQGDYKGKMFNLFISDKEMTKNIEGDQTGIVITDLMSLEMFETDNGVGKDFEYKFKSPYTSQDETIKTKVTGIIKTDYKEKKDLSDDWKSISQFKYRIAYMGKDAFKNVLFRSNLQIITGFIDVTPTYKLTTQIDQSERAYDLGLKFAIYNNEINNISKLGKYDVILSNKMKEEVKNKTSLRFIDIENKINDFGRNASRVVNISKVNSQVKIKGFTDTKADILVSKEYYNELFNAIENYIYKGFSISSGTNKIDEKIKNILNDDIEVSTFEAKAMYTLKHVLSENGFKFGFFVILGIFSTIMLSFILFSTNSLLTMTKKDLLTLKMERVHSYKIISPLMMQEFLKLIIAFLVSLPVMVMGILKLNRMFASANNHSEMNPYFSVKPLALGIDLIVCLIFIGFTIILSLSKIHKMNLSKVIKDTL